MMLYVRLLSDCFLILIWYLKLSIQAQTLEAVIQNWSKKSHFKDLKFVREHPWSFTKY